MTRESTNIVVKKEKKWRWPSAEQCGTPGSPVKALLRARLENKYGKITIITFYTPTYEAKEEDKDDFYTLLSSELALVTPHEYLVLLGDMNASISNESGLWDFAVGPVTVDSVNDNKAKILNYCLVQILTIASIWFQRYKIAKYTWYSNDGTTKKMLAPPEVPILGTPTIVLLQPKSGFA
ncbi:hypothetical protein QYM36_020042 [Artemia franciscana]|uniref:Endonuclease/exonuclease/phosphatase domain-containing protein n=1 Tax=Artemia franciscana TaxID=6661 RepID=A0AA88H0G9_ARTSF|nr:hypothetical protein QYM36_020042 [Artemia franciscana]